jgi:hypothetical protein
MEKDQSEIIAGLRATRYKWGTIHPIHHQGRQNQRLRGHHRELQQTPQQGQPGDEGRYGNVESKGWMDKRRRISKTKLRALA